ncbi:HK97 gp10 family phage protein [Aerococcus sp. UMB8608]|uniref:HK97 gp10 family phage protein n=1 Tax=Aerococcus sanguinicola TaxID=119206 RepID=A0A0X8FCT6_9LACT|nr:MULTISPECIES: HK97 gp10 family phage protein [Aerococcus]AMB94902.1 hypothetical protein AWM72_09105 [Aerococcus sanguinicola]MDK6679350.1 HK97 gp10 family phage protein [Aerococcus sp. UMB8608]MDK6685808.1 HK97 gp10 family phage protein [Aerococcus sp. UMB8623]OFT95887.1 hypothetical protein HMPREF3090_03440 [Aerococcus sp. HMSC23C02]
MSIKIDELSKKLADEVATYTNDVVEGIQKDQKEIAKETAKKLRAASPKRTGKYRKSWGTKKEGLNTYVRNRKHYRLTHLLEKGHRTRNRKRQAPAYPHIGPIEKEAISKFEKAVEKRVKKG